MQLNLDKAKREEITQQRPEMKRPPDAVIPDLNTCWVRSAVSLACFYLKTRSAQISILAPELVISSNFFRGRPDKFSALNGVFLAEINNRAGIYHTGLFFHSSGRFM